jgi:DNA-binding LacI/PurR family transcriptional regulator
VSVTTASRALNNKGELSAESRALVLAAAERLRYVPNDVARTLVSGQSMTLGVMLTDIASPVYAEVLAGIEDGANAQGYSVLYMNSGEDHEMAGRCLRTLRAKHVDGVLFTPLLLDTRMDELAELDRLGIPLVALLRKLPDVAMDFVVTDNVKAGELATRHLMELGHTQIAHLGGVEGAWSTDARAEGYAKTLGAAGVALDPALVVRTSHTIDEGHRAALELLRRPDPPTAIYAATLPQGLGTLRAVREMGMRIPTDVALVAGDESQFAQYLEPPLTTVQQPSRAMGSTGAALMLQRLAGRRKRPKGIVLQPNLIVRRSTVEDAEGFDSTVPR